MAAQIAVPNTNPNKIPLEGFNALIKSGTLSVVFAADNSTRNALQREVERNQKPIIRVALPKWLAVDRAEVTGQS
jgi:hypothetical protein